MKLAKNTGEQNKIDLYLLLQCCKQLLTKGLFLQLTLCFMMGLLPYIYLPVAAFARQARWTWGDQSTVIGFFTHLLRVEYGTLLLVSKFQSYSLFDNLFSILLGMQISLQLFPPPLLSIDFHCTDRGKTISWFVFIRSSNLLVAVLLINKCQFSYNFIWKNIGLLVLFVLKVRNGIFYFS